MRQLSELNIHYIILAKENDYRDFTSLLNQSAEPVIQTDTIDLYRLKETNYAPTY
jgi:hypothetical protein